jgi:hypothetical protein
MITIFLDDKEPARSDGHFFKQEPNASFVLKFSGTNPSGHYLPRRNPDPFAPVKDGTRRDSQSAVSCVVLRNSQRASEKPNSNIRER